MGDMRTGDSEAAALSYVSRMNPPTQDRSVPVQLVSENLRLKKHQSPNEIISKRDVEISPFGISVSHTRTHTRTKSLKENNSFDHPSHAMVCQGEKLRSCRCCSDEAASRRFAASQES